MILKLGNKKLEFIVKENSLRFLVNLSDYIDTGLFFDHRPLRKKVQQTAEKKSVLNLFCYTGAFSVYAASGKAKSVTSVDLSKKYLDWAKNNLKLNGYSDEAKYQFVASDVKTFLENDKNQYDIIVLEHNERRLLDVFEQKNKNSFRRCFVNVRHCFGYCYNFLG